MSNNPIVNFISISGQEVSATYADLPSSSLIVFVNQTSGQPLGGGLAASGSASVTIPVPADAPPGAYYLKAQDSAGAYLAQSVVFYIDTAAGKEA